MIYVMGQIWSLLLVALLLGAVIAWLWMRLMAKARMDVLIAPWRDRVAALERERDGQRRETAEARDRAVEAEAQLSASRVGLTANDAKVSAGSQALEPPDPAERDAAEMSDQRRDADAIVERAAQPAIERDDLTRIKGIGKALQRKLNAIDIVSFAQVADLTPSDIARIEPALQFRGRIERDNWIDQARALVAESTS